MLTVKPKIDIKIGADPELFMEEKGEIVSAFNVIPGSKYDPYPVENGAVQVDGMALEFNIIPATASDEFVYNITSVMQQLRKMLPKGTDFAIKPTAHFSEEYMERQHPISKLLGCEPDFNAYTGEMNPKPEEHPTMRTAAGHVHIGWGTKLSGENHFQNCINVVKLLDLHLGIPSLILDQDQDRRKLYGKAGAFRPKPYGVEYRVLSNFWLRNSSLMEWVFNESMRVANDYFLYYKDDNYNPFHYNIDVQTMINTGDTIQAIEAILFNKYMVKDKTKKMVFPEIQKLLIAMPKHVQDRFSKYITLE